MQLRNTELFKKLQLLAVEFCDLPKLGLSQTLNSKKKAMEISYINSPSKLSFVAASLLNNTQNKIERQDILEIDDLQKRIQVVSEHLVKEIQFMKKSYQDFEKQGGNTGERMPGETPINHAIRTSIVQQNSN